MSTDKNWTKKRMIYTSHVRTPFKNFFLLFSVIHFHKFRTYEFYCKWRLLQKKKKKKTKKKKQKFITPFSTTNTTKIMQSCNVSYKRDAKFFNILKYIFYRIILSGEIIFWGWKLFDYAPWVLIEGVFLESNFRFLVVITYLFYNIHLWIEKKQMMQ